LKYSGIYNTAQTGRELFLTNSQTPDGQKVN
jgi:hypothetical protein